MGRTVSLTEAKAKLNELVREARDDNVVLVRHGQPAAVMVSPEHYEGLLEEIEDLKDRLSLHASDPGAPNVPLSSLRSELALPDVVLARLAGALGSSIPPSPDLTEWAAKLAPSFAALDIGAPASDVLAAITAAATESILAFLRTVLNDLSEGTSARSA